MIWPRWLDNQPSHRWLRETVGLVTKGLHSGYGMSFASQTVGYGASRLTHPTSPNPEPLHRLFVLHSGWRRSATPRTSHMTSKSPSPPRLRSRLWFDNPDNPGMTALYLERYLNYGITSAELRSGKPIIGIAQTGSDLSPCNRHHLELAHRVREGIRSAGGVAFEFPCHPIQETGKRPTAALDRNLSYLSLVEVLFGYPLDGVVLTTGCDKTTPAAIM